MAQAHLAVIGNMVREKEFTTPVDGTGELTVDIKDFLKVSLGPDGLQLAPPPEPMTAKMLIFRKKG